MKERSIRDSCLSSCRREEPGGEERLCFDAVAWRKQTGTVYSASLRGNKIEGCVIHRAPGRSREEDSCWRREN